MIVCDWCGLKISEDGIIIKRDYSNNDLFSDNVFHFHSDCWELVFDTLSFALDKSAPVNIGIFNWDKKRL